MRSAANATTDENANAASVSSATNNLESSAVTVSEVLTLVAQDVSSLIPAERGMLFVYDKSANLLKPQLVFSRTSRSDTADSADSSSDSIGAPADAASASPATTARSTFSASDSSASFTSSTPTHQGFPPVMGMVSACFLHKRCLRMQEPRPVRSQHQPQHRIDCSGLKVWSFRYAQHRAFHRDYDAPKDMDVDSILCAPIILHHRVIGVIQVGMGAFVWVTVCSPAHSLTASSSWRGHLQLLNRIDHDGDGIAGHQEALPGNTPSAVGSAWPRSASTNTRPGAHYEDERGEIKLRRHSTAKVHARIGFSPKDEQKLIQFASHIAVRVCLRLLVLPCSFCCVL